MHAEGAVCRTEERGDLRGTLSCSSGVVVPLVQTYLQLLGLPDIRCLYPALKNGADVSEDRHKPGDDFV